MAKDLTATMRRLGFVEVPDDPCLFVHISNPIMAFFYVDDIVLISPKSLRQDLYNIRDQLMKVYEIREIGPLHHFLGARDRKACKLWLSQADYIDKTNLIDNCDPTNSIDGSDPNSSQPGNPSKKSLPVRKKAGSRRNKPTKPPTTTGTPNSKARYLPFDDSLEGSAGKWIQELRGKGDHAVPVITGYLVNDVDNMNSGLYCWLVSTDNIQTS
jgi:hypothetical protein